MCAITFADTWPYERARNNCSSWQNAVNFYKRNLYLLQGLEAHEVYTGSQRHQNEGTKTSEQEVTFSLHKEHFSGHK